MKTLLYLICLLSISGYCYASATGKIRKQAESIIKKNIHQPKSYKFVSLTPMAGLTVGECLEQQTNYLKNNIQFEESLIQSSESSVKFYEETIASNNKNEWETTNYQQHITEEKQKQEKLRKEIEKQTNYLNEITNLKEKLSGNLTDMILENYQITFSSKNTSADTILQTAYIQINVQTKKVINVAMHKNEMYIIYKEGIPEMNQLNNKYNN